MKRKTLTNAVLFFFVLLAASALLISGCGNGRKEAPASAATGVATIGFEQCYNCHADAKNPAALSMPFGDSPSGSATLALAGISGAVQTTGPDFRLPYNGWLNGPHGNYESVAGFAKIDLAPANTGFPEYSEFIDGTTCQACHDPLGEGKTIADFYFKTGIAVLGTVDRPVIGCESCHGGGANHWGMGPLPNDRPGPAQCGQCHNASFRADHLPFHPEGARIVEDYNASKHAASVNATVLEVSGSATDVVTPCARCHTDEGAKRYLLFSAGTMTHDQLVAALNGKPAISNASPVQCRTCHDSHNQLIILGQKALDAGIVPDAWSDEFATCTSCHQLYAAAAVSAAGPLLDNGYHAPKDLNGDIVNPFSTDWFIYIPSTHFDDPATDTIEGYIVDPTASHDPGSKNTNSGTCRDCHNPHNADITINKQWARSAHGGHILTSKEAAAAAGGNVYTAGVTTIDEPAFTEDFKTSGCGSQRCHTATGFRTYANDPATYASLVSLPAASFVATGLQQELLYCWACHTSNTGNLRNPGAIVSLYPPVTGATPTFTFPDASGSNVCMTCHSGRRGGGGVYSDATVTYNNKSFSTPHHAVSAGVLYKTIGYEYTGATGTYANVPYFEHDKIGTSGFPGSNGPCVGCHMSTPESHLFEPATVNETTGAITALNSTVCAKCHTGQHALTAAALEAEKADFEAAAQALMEQLQARGVWFDADPAVLSFFTDNTYTTAKKDWTWAGDATGKNTYGAAFDFYLLRYDDKGSFAHNRIYAKRLIYDSIDFLDDGVFNNSVGATLNALPGGTSYKAAAMTYLLPSGVTGTVSERP